MIPLSVFKDGMTPDNATPLIVLGNFAQEVVEIAKLEEDIKTRKAIAKKELMDLSSRYKDVPKDESLQIALEKLSDIFSTVWKRKDINGNLMESCGKVFMEQDVILLVDCKNWFLTAINIGD